MKKIISIALLIVASLCLVIGCSSSTPTLSGISVTTKPTKTVYKVGDTLDLTGMVVTATYSDGKTSVITKDKYTTSPADGTKLEKAEKVTVTVSYEKKTDSFIVTVGQPTTEGFITMWYLDIADLNSMADLDSMIESNQTLSKNFATYIITGGAQTYVDPQSGGEVPQNNYKQDPFEKDEKGDYCYPALAKALIASGVKEEDGNPFKPSFTENVYQYWSFAPDASGTAVFKEIWKTTKLMSDGDTLKNFINKVYDATKNTENAKYILMLWNHGDGSVGGLCGDHTQKQPPYMANLALRKAIEDSDFNKAGKKFDAVIFDMCLMQTIEDIFLLKGFTKCVIGSENYSYASGYGEFFNYLSKYPTSTYTAVAKAFITAAEKVHKESKTEAEKTSYTWSAIDFADDASGSKFNALKDAYVTFINEVSETSSDGYTILKKAAEASVSYNDGTDRSHNYDILSVAKRFFTLKADTGVMIKYEALKSAINAVLIDSVCGPKVKKGTDGEDPGTTGLAFFFCPTLGEVVGEGKRYSEKDFLNYCELVKTYISEDVEKFYIAYKNATTK